jgi:thiamine-phosphate pyrophosphorylase
MATANIDYSLYLVTDRNLAKGRSTLEIVQAAVEGGVTCVQLREKECSILEFIQQALAVKDFLKDRGVPLIINDRVDVALAVAADGVHLGQTDMPLQTAQKIVGGSMIIGISAESLEDAVEAERGGADYLGVSPIYATPTKPDTAPPLGLEGLKAIREAVKLPLVSAIVAAGDPAGAARNLKQIIDEARKA